MVEPMTENQQVDALFPDLCDNRFTYLAGPDWSCRARSLNSSGCRPCFLGKDLLAFLIDNVILRFQRCCQLKRVVSTCRSSPPIAGIVRLERMRKVVSLVLGRLSGLELRSAGGARAGAVWQPCPSAPQAQRANGHSGSS